MIPRPPRPPLFPYTTLFRSTLIDQALCRAFGADRVFRSSHAMHGGARFPPTIEAEDRKSTRLNSSHPSISYAVFCLKKKRTTMTVEIFCSRYTLYFFSHQCN